MALLNPEHLFEQADQLVAQTGQRVPRQASLRRAVSTTYYALFHAIVTDIADQLVGIGQRGTRQYALVYRSIEHRELVALCKNIIQEPLPHPYRPYEPQGGFGPDLLAVAKALIDLQQKRHNADYDPLYHVAASDAALTLQAGRTAFNHWRNVPRTRRRLFILLVAFHRRIRSQ
jgi:hypothetical protein